MKSSLSQIGLRMASSRSLLSALVLGLAMTAPVAHRDALAQTNELVIPIAAGGAMDAALRAVGGELAKTWGEPVVPVNKPGAGMALGVRYLLGLSAESKSMLGGGLPAHRRAGRFGDPLLAARASLPALSRASLLPPREPALLHTRRRCRRARARAREPRRAPLDRRPDGRPCLLHAHAAAARRRVARGR